MIRLPELHGWDMRRSTTVSLFLQVEKNKLNKVDGILMKAFYSYGGCRVRRFEFKFEFEFLGLWEIPGAFHSMAFFVGHLISFLCIMQ